MPLPLSREEFTKGCHALKSNSVETLRGSLDQLKKEVQEKENFRDLYRYTFQFSLDGETVGVSFVLKQFKTSNFSGFDYISCSHKHWRGSSVFVKLSQIHKGLMSTHSA